MLLFRSEEHLDRWLESPDNPSGERLTIAQQWELARLWFEGRDRAEWRKRSAPEAEAIFTGAGLSGDFWKLG